MSVTLDQLAEAIQQAAAESAKTNHILRTDVLPRLDSLEGIVREAGLNGSTPLLKQFLEEYGQQHLREQAWQTVRSDLTRRFGWLRSPRSWIKATFYAVLGGIGWQLAAGHLPHIPGIH